MPREQLTGDLTLRQAYPKINANAQSDDQLEQEYDNHKQGIADRHTGDQVDDSSNYALSTVTAVLNLIKTTFEEHFSGTADRHLSGQIDNDSTVGDGSTGLLNGVLENLQSQITALVLGGTDTDPRLTQALIDFENTDWSTLGFKALQDFWQERIVELEKYYADLPIPPETITNQSPTITLEVNNGGITPVISGSGSTETNYLYALEDGGINASGVEFSDSNLKRTVGYIPLEQGETLYFYSGGILTQFAWRIFDTSEVFLATPGDTLTSYTATQDCLVRGYGTNEIMNDNAMLLKNGTYAGDYIKGTQNLTDLKFDIRGENLLVDSVYLGGYRNSDGSLSGDVDVYKPTQINTFVEEGKTYTLSYPSYIDCRRIYGDYHFVASGIVSGYQFTATENDVLSFSFRDSGGGDVDWTHGNVPSESEIMFVEGTNSPSSYIEPFHNEAYVPVTLTSKDNYTIKGGKMVVDRNVRVIESLDGVDYDWSIYGSATGRKTLSSYLDKFSKNFNSLICTKFNRKNVTAVSSIDSYDQCFFLIAELNRFIITINNNDSGWGESYTPTADEIKAYFNGWVMYDSVTFDKYAGVNAKRWAKRYQGIRTKTSLTHADVEDNTVMTVVPKEKAYGDITETYKLQYDLSEPVREEIDLIGDMTMPEGRAYMTMESGVRFEKANPAVKSDGTRYYYNVLNHPSTNEDSPFSKKAEEILRVFTFSSDIKKDITSLCLNEPTYAYGDIITSVSADDVSKDEANNVYIEYKTLSEEHNTNVFDAQVTYKDDLINVTEVTGQKLAYQAEQLDILQTQKASKNQEAFREPTLLNGWIGSNVYYYKDEMGRVHLTGSVTGGSGIAFSTISSYAPKNQLTFNIGTGTVIIGTDGSVTPSGNLNLDGISWRV